MINDSGGRKCATEIRGNENRCVQRAALSVLTLLLAFFAAFPVGPAFGINIVHVDFLFDIKGDFNEPSDVAVAKSGRIYVVDGVNNRIKVFRSDGAPLSSFGEKGRGNGRFWYPLGIDVDNAGNVYVADSGNSRIQIFSPDNTFAAAITLPDRNGEPADPTDVAVDASQNRMYVVDNNNHRFLVYDLSTRKLIRSVGDPGDQELMFRYPFFIALNEQGYLYIVDVINTRVQVVSPDGKFVAYVGAWGVEKGQFFRPKGVAVDTDNRVYVSDSYMGVIQVFDTWGELYGVIGDAGKQAVKKFRTPVGLFIDDRNRLYVVEMLAQKVSVYGIRTESQ